MDLSESYFHGNSGGVSLKSVMDPDERKTPLESYQYEHSCGFRSLYGRYLDEQEVVSLTEVVAKLCSSGR